MEFRVEIAVEDSSLDRRTAEVAYRVVQESVSNAIRHGRPAAIAIAVTPLARVICVRVCDDGEGLGSTQAGTGLTGMTERAPLRASWALERTLFMGKAYRKSGLDYS